MFDGIISFAINNKVSLIFYTVLILLIITFRHKLEWQGIAGLYKTTVGVKTMQTLSDKYAEWFRWLGYVGVGIGFLGMFAIVAMLIYGLWQLVFQPTAPAVIAPVVPGFEIPGIGIHVPLIIGWLALFFVIVIHEFSHGVVSKSHKIPIKSSGLLVFGPLLGAFVEPDEKKMSKASDIVQYSVFAAGPFSNILSAVVSLLLVIGVSALVGMMTVSTGIGLGAVGPESPAALAGLEAGMIITAVNNQTITTQDDFLASLTTLREGEDITLHTQNNSYVVTAGPDTDPRTDKGLIGVSLRENYEPVVANWLFQATLLLQEFVLWLFILHLGIGLANLLPLGPVDGGRMIHTLFTHLWGKERGERRWKQLSLITLVTILVLLIVPITRGFF